MLCRSSTERNLAVDATLVSLEGVDKQDTCQSWPPPTGRQARLVVLGWQIGGRWSDCESVGDSEVPQATPAIETVSETRTVPPVAPCP